MVIAYDQGEMLFAFLSSIKTTVCYLQMRADCMHLALGLMRQWRSIATSLDLASLVLLASFQALGKFGGIKLIKPKSPFCDKVKVDFLNVFQQVLWAVYPPSVWSRRQATAKCNINAKCNVNALCLYANSQS